MYISLSLYIYIYIYTYQLLDVSCLSFCTIYVFLVLFNNILANVSPASSMAEECPQYY